MDVLSQQPIVIDNGTGTIKAGFAGEDKPSLLLTAATGRAKHTRVMAGGALDGDV
jgi:centractin